MGALGVYIGLPPRGTMAIRLDAGPAISASGLRLLHRLVGPADWLGREPTGRVRRGRVLPAADYCSRASDGAGLVMESWQQPRRLAGVHYCHSPSHLINDVWALREEPADSLRVRLVAHWPSSGIPLAGGTRRPKVVQTSHRERRIRSTGADVRASMATVPHRMEISAGTAYCDHAMLVFGKGWEQSSL